MRLICKDAIMMGGLDLRIMQDNKTKTYYFCIENDDGDITLMEVAEVNGTQSKSERED